jgi:response regulator NasT
MRKAILCIEEREVLASLKSGLKEQGFAEIIECSSTGELVVEATETYPEIAVLEFSSKNQIVHAAVKKLWERLGIPIILIVDNCNLESAQKGGDAGISAILTKPVRKDELTAALTLSLTAAGRLDSLREEVATLKESIESRKVVEKAKGRLMERDGLTEAEAFRRMQKLSMNQRISMRQLAEAILLTDRIGC